MVLQEKYAGDVDRPSHADNSDSVQRSLVM